MMDKEFYFKWSECQLRLKELLKEGWQCSVVINIDGEFVIRKDIKINEPVIKG